VRGTVVSLDGSTLTVKTREGPASALALRSGWKVTGVAKASVEDIKPGDFVGIASLPTAAGGDGAVEVLVFPAALKGTGEGSYPWDLKPKTTMTNATVTNAVKDVDGRTVTLSYHGDSVPSPHDPPNASEFYHDLGIAVVAWGRLEGNFNNLFVTVLNIATDPEVGKRFYIKREKQSVNWTLAFETTPSLTQHKNFAKAILASMDELGEFRDMCMHGLWEGFVPEESPPAMRISKLKPRGEEPDGLWLSQGKISVNDIRQFIGEANRLNTLLFTLSEAVIPLRGEAPQDVYRC